MAGIGDLSESKYVQKEDVGNGRTVIIADYERTDVSQQGEPQSMKYVLHFKECKPLVLNVTNGKRIAMIMSEVYGLSRKPEKDGQNSDGSDRWVPQCERFDNWIDKKIILWFNPDIEFAGKVTGGIRVRPPQNVVAAQDDGPPPPTDDDIPIDDDDIPF